MRCSDDPCDRAQHGAVYVFGLTDLQAGFAPDLRSIAVFAMLGATHLICKKSEKQLHRQF